MVKLNFKVKNIFNLINNLKMSYYWKILKNYYEYSELKRGSFYDIIKDFMSYRNNDNYSFLEVLNIDYKRNKQVPIRLYIDIDGLEISNDSAVCTTILLINRYMFYFLEKKGIIKTSKINKYKLFRIFNEKIKMTYNKSSNTHKGYSFHIIYPIILDNVNAIYIKLLIKEFKMYLYDYFKTMIPRMSEHIKHVDINVYSKNRLFRGILSYQPGMLKNGKTTPRNIESCHKPCEIIDRDLIILNEEDYDLFDYIIQYTLDVEPFNEVYVDIRKIKEYEDYDVSNKIIYDYNKIFGNQKFGSQMPYVINDKPKTEDIKPEEIKEEEKEDNKEIKQKENEIKREPKTEIKQNQETNIKNLLILMVIMNIMQIIYNIIFK